MTHGFWKKRWSEGRTGFHREDVNPSLTNYADRWLGDEPRRVLVPLCGKSVDLLWLRSEGHRVVGVEFVEQAAVEFFDTHDIEFERRSLPGEIGAGYHADGLDFLVADIFSVGAEHIGEVDRVFDRAAIVALPEATRKKYAEHMLSVLPQGARILLVSFAYDTSAMSGPPHSVSNEEIRDLFGQRCEMELLEELDILDRTPKFRDRGLGELFQSVWLMTRR